jgi:proline iminopeptidase
MLIAHSGGPGLDARFWDDCARIDEFVTVVALHPRGSGLSDPAPAGAYLRPDYAADGNPRLSHGDLEALRQHLDLHRPLVMGWSHGGMVAQEFACTYPGSLSRLILVDSRLLR